MDVPVSPFPGVRVVARHLAMGEGTLPEDWAALSPRERARAEGMGSDRARASFVVGRSLLRRALADALGVLPTEVPLEATDGRPVLACDGPAFSVSHAEGRAVVAIAIDPTGPATVGVDVEAADRWPLPPARSWLTDTEHDHLPNPNDDATRRTWVRQWTAKEAVAKAWGTGLGTPLRAISVDGDRATVTGHEPAVWSVHHLDDWPAHVVTIAVPAD